MSSWIIAKSIVKKKAPASALPYHDTTGSSSDIPTLYLECIAAYVYSQKMGETCSIWDPTGILSTSLRYNPQVNILKEKPEVKANTVSSYESFLASMKYKDVQKFALTLMDYTPVFQNAIRQVLEKAALSRQTFDIALHIVADSSGESMMTYVDIVKAYQAKTKKTTLSIYIMTDSYDNVRSFQHLGLPTWKVTSLSRAPVADVSEGFLRMMAEVQVLTTVPALILDFKQPIDRLIYLLQRQTAVSTFFKEVNDRPWRLLEF